MYTRGNKGGRFAKPIFFVVVSFRGFHFLWNGEPRSRRGIDSVALQNIRFQAVWSFLFLNIFAFGWTLELTNLGISRSLFFFIFFVECICIFAFIVFFFSSFRSGRSVNKQKKPHSCFCFSRWIAEGMPVFNRKTKQKHHARRWVNHGSNEQQ